MATTGRLKGGAGVEFQSYNEYHQNRGESPAELWDVDWLVPGLVQVLVEGVPALDRARTLEMLGRLGCGSGDRAELRKVSQGWFRDGLTNKERWSHVLGAAFLAKEAADRGREDLACQVAFLLIRAAWETPVLDEGQRAAELDVARRLFSAHAETFWETVRKLDPLHVTFESNSGIDLFVVHNVKVARLCECLALLGIWRLLQGDDAGAAELGEYVADVVAATTGCAHPASDEWSFSLLCTGLFLAMTGRRDAAGALLEQAAVWLLDKIEYGSGIAGVGASPHDAVRQLLGPPYSHLDVPREPAAYGFAVALDLAHVPGRNHLYGNLVNDLEALSAMATLVVEQQTGIAQLVARADYASVVGLPAAHHAIPIDALPAAREGAYFDCLAGWATTRDRHLPSMLRQLCGPNDPEERAGASTAADVRPRMDSSSRKSVR
ncbi:hypothetical protein ACTMSW_18865 [Micromonospora sp. BQ11]|uniref:hypothetical protein n=1 Tax=Micromonospora sp. BQ11 TaxID=3452212 RepID=UPI003F8C296C